ncbi:MAG TPA: hypothetical protein PLD38_10260 [Pyrinomonadaceae bacterium]|nr:hypothetical protein [Chloracidobacterium sp.]MBK7803894.1 hypothetical protein [Chloracidobacterium sp.]MBK9439435.1 hypothetical protein [Chloracidobacterium sp.]MBL0239278.1 hypothetical protein [Chloracidobacterium sp.]HQY67652.1 hypothetical protein [Pyrinomonadaceae bacterium]
MKKVRVMPADVKKIFDEIQKDVLDLHYRWRAFGELYADSKAIDCMNYAAPNFFTYIYDAMLSDLISAIARLTDNKTIAGKDTLGFKQLIYVIEQTGLKMLPRQLNARLIKANAQLDKVRQLRNMRVSHSNLDIRTNRTAKKLPTLQKSELQSIVSDFARMLNITDEYFGEAPMMYQDFDRSDSGRNLIYHLQVAKKLLESPDKVELLTKFATA